MIKEIQSVQNPLVKFIVSLGQKKNIVKSNVTFVEGEKIVSELLQKNAPVKTVLVTKRNHEFLNKCFEQCETYIIGEQVANKISGTITNAGIFALVELPKQQPFNRTKPYLVLDNIQDPTNLGAIVRSALAFNTTQLILVGGVFPFLPKVIRSSMGYIFGVQCYEMSFAEFVPFVQKQHLNLCGAKMDGQAVSQANLTNVGFVVGNEGNGIDPQLLALCTGFVAIPMENGVESLNASVSASILLYEQNKQFKN